MISTVQNYSSPRESHTNQKIEKQRVFLVSFPISLTPKKHISRLLDSTLIAMYRPKRGKNHQKQPTLTKRCTDVQQQKLDLLNQ